MTGEYLEPTIDFIVLVFDADIRIGHLRFCIRVTADHISTEKIDHFEYRIFDIIRFHLDMLRCLTTQGLRKERRRTSRFMQGFHRFFT